MEEKLKLKVVRDNVDSTLPTKGTSQSVGYDLTIISLHKQLSDRTALYDTGIKVCPPPNHYVEILPRSSLTKTGYMLSNSVGIIDPDYTGRLLVALTKVDESFPNLVLPCTRFQMVMRECKMFEIEETDCIEETERGSGGFGSTDK